MATIKNLAELKVRGVLEEGDEVVFTVKGEAMTYRVGSGFLSKLPTTLANSDKVFTALGMSEAAYLRFCRKAYGYSDTSSSDEWWPEYRSGDFEAATRLVEALYVEIARQELRLPKTETEAPAAPAAKEHRFAEGDLLYDPEDEDYACILAASSDGNVFALSQWTTDRSDEDMLSTPDEILTLEEIKGNNYILAPAEEPKKVLRLTRDQIAEKFGVDPDQLEIHDEAA